MTGTSRRAAIASRFPAALIALGTLVSALGCAAVQTEPWPGKTWPTSSPVERGLDPAPLLELERSAAAGTFGNLDRLFVVRDGYVVLDRSFDVDYREVSRGQVSQLGCGWESCPDAAAESDPYNYFHPSTHPFYHGRAVHSLQSATKSVAATAIAIAIARGEIAGVDARLLDFFGDYDISGVDPRLHDATLADLLTMRSGIEWHEWDRPLDETNTTYQLEHAEDWIQFTLDQPSDAAPGEKFVYSSGGSHLMSGVVRQATGQHLHAYADRHLFGPLGIDDYHWKTTPKGYADTEGGLYLDAPDLARIGYLYLNDGVWDGRRILPEGWVEAATRRHVDDVGDSRGYGYQWWRIDRGGTEVWAGMGFGDNYLVVIPEHEIVAVANAWNVFGQRRQNVVIPLVDALLAAVGG